VHCSDGWDRTSQVAALAQLILDEYYRTIEGFEVLIEKDFVAFGHQFKMRLGYGVENTTEEKDFCPVFIQFLDCVYQIIYQFPTLFEFNVQFLTDIAYHAFSLKFGTFIGNCEKERTELKVRQKTCSLWSELNSKKEKYVNMLYNPKSPLIDKRTFYPETIPMRMKFWEELYVKWVLPPQK
jgi:myotubularin-related protein 6/7/8